MFKGTSGTVIRVKNILKIGHHSVDRIALLLGDGSFGRGGQIFSKLEI